MPEETSGQWPIALHTFWELLGPLGYSDSTQCFDILNRVLVESAQWQLSQQLMSHMLEQRLSPSGMHIATTAKSLEVPDMKATLLYNALDLWKANAPEHFQKLWHTDLEVMLAEADCHLKVLASRPGILVISKPPNITTEAILEDLTDCISTQDVDLAEFTTVSRLDYPTSGVLVIAHGSASSPATNWLQVQFASRLVKKEYLCLVEGRSLGEVGGKGEINQPLLTTSITSSRGPSARAEVSPLGREALTEYEVLQRFPKAKDPLSTNPTVNDPMELIYLRVKPLTGRMHQIRAHFASIGRPLVPFCTV